MKKIIYILSLTVVLMMVTCTDILETSPKDGSITDATYFKTAEEYDAVMFGIYSELVNAQDWINLNGFISQDMYGPDQIPKVLSQLLTVSHWMVSGMWTKFYKISARANTVLDELASSTIPDADKSRLEGEALFFRGFAYFNIAQAFGNAPLILKPYDVSQSLLECTPEAEIWDQVIADLTAAAAKLPEREEWATEYLGRATKGAAYAYLVNAYMYKEDWEGAETASNSLIALGTYSLMPNVRDVFSLTNQNNAESIFEVQFRDVLDGNVTWQGLGEWGSTISEYTAPRNIGAEWAPSNGWGEMVSPRKLADSFEPGDDRRAKLIAVPGDPYKGELMTDTMRYNPDTQDPLNGWAATCPYAPGTEEYETWIGWDWNKSCFSTKYWYGPSDVDGASYFFRINIPLMRYAEFLLNYSEVLFMRGKTQQAYDQLNLVRQRALLPNLPEQTDQATFITALMKERRAELNYEFNLWYHYVRTETAASFLQSEYNINWDPTWNKMPIPQADRDQNPNLCQNPGY